MGYDVFFLCVLCWNEGRIEKHHVSGRVNHNRVIPVCRNCHLILTRHQHRSGLCLSEDERTDLELMRAIVVGYQGVTNLFSHKASLNLSTDIASVLPVKQSKMLYAFGISDE